MPQPSLAFRRLHATDRVTQSSAHRGGVVARIRRALFEERRFREYGRLIGRALALPPDEVEIIARALPYRDLGKLSVPARILFKPAALDDEEREEIERHTYYGAWTVDRLGEVDFEHEAVLWAGRTAALTHHERWDGQGYPLHLSGAAIPRVGRVAMLADIYDALRSRRAYKAAYPHDQARDIILNGDERTAPDHFDPELLQVFRDLDRRFAEIYESHNAPALRLAPAATSPHP